MATRVLRVGIHQKEPGSGLSPAELSRYRDAGVELLVLPEYFWVREGDADHRAAAGHHHEDLAHLAALSAGVDLVLVGGTVIEPEGDALYNTCPVFWRGREHARYRKRRLMPGEARRGIQPGNAFSRVRVDGYHLAPVICADVLYPDTFTEVANLKADVVAAPMSSPYREVDPHPEKDRRDRDIFLAGARTANTVIVKAASVGTLFGRPLQGRCLVAGPQGIVFRTPFAEEREPREWIVDVELKGTQP